MNKQRVLQALEFVKSNPYGKWGILNIEQRRFIKELCNSWLVLDEATNMQTKEIERLTKQNKSLNETYELTKKEYIRLNNIIKEVRESAKRELKIAEENIKQSEKWLDIEEEKGHAKRDIHTGKVVKRYMEMFLEILDKGE